MFPLAGLQIQAAAPLTQLWNTVCVASQTVARSARVPYRPQSHSITVTTATDEPITASDLSTSIKDALVELDFQCLAENVCVDCLHPVLSVDVHRRSDLWAKDHVSAQTFFENKHGFKEAELCPLTQQPSTLQPKAFRVSIPDPRTTALTSRWIPQSFLQPRRGFKTKRSESRTGFGQKAAVENDTSGNGYFKGLVFSGAASSSKAKQTEKFNSLLSEYDHTPEAQDKLKVAFAEGYLASDKQVAEKTTGKTWLNRIAKFLAFGVMVYVILVFMQSYGGPGNNMRNITMFAEKVEPVNPEEITVRFEDVKGVDEAKEEFQDTIEFLRDSERFKSMGAKLPRGILLVGPPGIGKTLLARAVAGEAGVPFFHASGSEFDEMFVGMGAARIRKLFDSAKAHAPCVVFLDEIDSVGGARSSSEIHPYANQTINQLLSEMDGFEQTEGVIVIGATNRRESLDKALLRPGRFDVEIRVFPPDFKGRQDIIRHYLAKVKVGGDVLVERLAKGTTGCTGADLENLVNQAAIKAALVGSTEVTMEHLEWARDKVLMGAAKKNRIPDEATNLQTAYHEAGHTLVAYFTKDSTPIHKVTIQPRGMSLGHTSFIPDKEQYSLTRGELLAEMDVAMGGRMAEEIIYGADKITTGASSDFQKATSIASAMVKKYGMSDKVGLRVFEDNSSYHVKLNDVSPAMSEVVDSEIRRLLQDSGERARQILKSHQSELNSLAKALMKYETLDLDDVKSIVDGKNFTKKKTQLLS